MQRSVEHQKVINYSFTALEEKNISYSGQVVCSLNKLVVDLTPW